MKLFIEYLKSIFTTWTTYLGVVPSVAALISTYTQYEIAYISQNLLYSTAVVLFLWSTFKVWEKEKHKNANLQAQLTNPVDYEFTAYAKKIILDEDFINNLAQNNLQDIPALVTEAEMNIDKLKSLRVDRVRYFTLGISKEKDERYVLELKKYIDELRAYQSQINQGISEWKSFARDRVSQLYEVEIEIQNKGSVYDENISLEILLGENNRVIEFQDIVDSLPDTLNPPAKPEYENPFNVSTGKWLPDLRDIESPYSFYRNINISKNSIKVTLRELKASENCYLLRGVLYIEIHDKKNIQATVLSKNSRKKIQKKIGVVDSGEIALHESLMAYDYEN